MILSLYPLIPLLVSLFFIDIHLLFIPIALAGIYIFLLKERFSELRALFLLFLFLSIPLLFENPLFILLSLPIIPSILASMERAAISKKPSSKKLRPSRLFLSLMALSLSSLILSLLIAHTKLLILSLTSTLFLLIILLISIRSPKKLVDEEKRELKIIAGEREELDIRLEGKGRGKVLLKSPYDWVNVKPEGIKVEPSRLEVKLSLAPPLSGPRDIFINALSTDRWGVLEWEFGLNPLSLHVIPRARYARWLAERFLARRGYLTEKGKTPGRKGIEYYGSRAYEPGDSLKTIDWKHTAKLRELVSKEFAEEGGEPPLVLINLCVRDEEEADILSFKIITTALTLAQENMPSSISVYDEKNVVKFTGMRSPVENLIESLKISEMIKKYEEPRRFLPPPPVDKIISNISRLRMMEEKPARSLSLLLEMGLKNIEDEALKNPAMDAYREGVKKLKTTSQVILISMKNHDADAVFFISLFQKDKGRGFIQA